MTKIYIISGKNPLTSSGGYARYGLCLAIVLKKLGFTPIIICIGDKPGIDKYNKIEIHSVAIPSPLLWLFKGQEMALLPVAATLISSNIQRHNSKAIVWGIGPWSLAGVFMDKQVSLIADYFTTVKHEYKGSVEGMTVQDYGILRVISQRLILNLIVPFFSLIEKVILTRAAKVVTHYASTESILKKQFTVPNNKIVRLPYFVYTSGINSGITSRKQSKKPLIIFIGRHDGRKGINYLLRALVVLNKKKVDFEAVLIGDGPLLRTHKRLASKLGLTNVSFKGYIADLEPYTLKADIFVLPSIEEGSSSLSLIEAMKNSLPIVASNIDGIPEDLTDRISGLLVKPKDINGLARNIEILINDRLFAQKLSQNAKKSYEKNFTLSAVLKHQEKFSNLVFDIARQR